ncbi:hypothetical protein ABK040_008650 [Willaertia magna]
MQAKDQQLSQQINNKRTIFISATHLSKQYKTIPEEELNNSIFFFGSDRCWVFPANPKELRLSKLQPTNYLGFEDEFKNLILKKEKEGLVYWLKPKQDFQHFSLTFLEKIIDPVTNQCYQPLILKDEYWLQELNCGNDDNNQGFKYVRSGRDVVMNYKLGEHDYAAVSELLEKSNPTLNVVLRK